MTAGPNSEHRETQGLNLGTRELHLRTPGPKFRTQGGHGEPTFKKHRAQEQDAGAQSQDTGTQAQDARTLQDTVT